MKRKNTDVMTPRLHYQKQLGCVCPFPKNLSLIKVTLKIEQTGSVEKRLGYWRTLKFNQLGGLTKNAINAQISSQKSPPTIVETLPLRDLPFHC